MEPFDYWIDYANSVLELTGAIYDSFDAIVTADNYPEVEQIHMGLYQDVIVDVARRSVDEDHPTLHSLVLLASWGTFETLVEDVCKNVLRIEPQRLGDQIFDKAADKATRQNLQEPERSETIIESTLNFVRQNCNKTGQSRFEAQLDAVGLGGSVPPAIADAVAKARALRNIWAHRNGIADKQFTADYPNGGYIVGSKILIGREECMHYVLALNTYAYIIMARFRVENGLSAVKCYQGNNPFKTDFNQLFPNAVTPESLLQ